MARTGYFIENQSEPHFLTFQVVGWVDVFTRTAYADMIIDSFRYCRENLGLRIHAYVIISNHIHCILSSENRDLITTIGRFKEFTSKKIIKSITEETESRKEWMLPIFEKAASQHVRNAKYQFWTHNNQPKEIETFDFMRQKANYIHDNPVNAGLVREPHHWVYSSASNYAGELSVLQVDVFEELVQDG